MISKNHRSERKPARTMHLQESTCGTENVQSKASPRNNRRNKITCFIYFVFYRILHFIKSLVFGHALVSLFLFSVTHSCFSFNVQGTAQASRHKERAQSARLSFPRLPTMRFMALASLMLNSPSPHVCPSSTEAQQAAGIDHLLELVLANWLASRRIIIFKSHWKQCVDRLP